MQGWRPAEIWFVNAMRGGASSGDCRRGRRGPGAVGDGIRQFGADIIFFPTLPPVPRWMTITRFRARATCCCLAASGAFCGAQTAVVAVAVFAVVGAIKTLASLPGARTKRAPQQRKMTRCPRKPLRRRPTRRWRIRRPGRSGRKSPLARRSPSADFYITRGRGCISGVDQYLDLVRETFLGK